MKGLELAKSYFETCALPVLVSSFQDLLPYLAAGLAGSGSECFGFDDPVSRDHDFEPGFCLFLPGEDTVSRRDAFLLERAMDKLPREFMGFKRSLMQPVGGSRHGVMRTQAWFLDKTGSEDGNLTPMQWLHLPDYALAEAVNGEIFLDNLGEVTEIRSRLSHYPEDIRRKKLAGHLLLMAQSGQYNYSRCLKHGETGAAQLAVNTFAGSCMQSVFLLNRVYQPFYKWSFRAMRGLPRLSLLAECLEYLITTGNDPDTAREKQELMESMAGDIILELKEQQLTGATCQDLEKHAYSVQDGIRDSEIRNMHILAGV